MNTYLEPQPVHTSPKSPHHPMIFPCFMLQFQKSHQKSSFFIDESHLNPMKTNIFRYEKKANSAQGQGRQGRQGPQGPHLPLQGFPSDSRRCSQVEAQSSGSWGSPAGTRMYHRRPWPWQFGRCGERDETWRVET